MSYISRFFDGVFGRGENAITVPAMDGALRPNTRLDDARIMSKAPGCDTLALIGGRLAWSQRHDLYLEGQPTVQFNANITFIADLPGGGAVVGCADGTLHAFPDNRLQNARHVQVRLTCPTAATALDGDTLAVACGSTINGPADWSRDLLEKQRTGSIVRVDLKTGETVTLASGLGWPAGVQQHAGGLVVAEAWRSRLVAVPLTGGRVKEVLGNLPGYPGRICRARDGYLLSIFAPRSQLLEFVLRERKFRETMMAEIEPDFWIAPSLRAGEQFLEPLQAGSVKQLGILKPWAPLRSVGLVVRLDRNLIPTESYHSRADGHRHGVTSAVEHDGQLYFTAKGDGIIGTLDVENGK